MCDNNNYNNNNNNNNDAFVKIWSNSTKLLLITVKVTSIQWPSNLLSVCCMVLITQTVARDIELLVTVEHEEDTGAPGKAGFARYSESGW